MSPKPRGRRPGMSFPEFSVRVAGDKAFATAIHKVDLEFLEYSCAIMEDTFTQYFRAEEAGDERRLMLVKTIFFSAAAMAMRHIDETGVTAAIGQLAHHLQDFSFEANAANLAIDHIYLTSKLGIPDRKVRQLWRFVDQHRSEVIRMLSRPGFSLEGTVRKAQKKPLYYGGMEPWQRLSPGGWTRFAGYALGCFNVGAAVGSLGLGTPVAVASVATGAAAVTWG